MRNLLTTLRTTVGPSQRWTREQQQDYDNATRSADPNKDEEKETEITELQELKRITKRDSKKERRLKFKQCFERNNVIMTVTKDDILKEKQQQDGADEDGYYYFHEDTDFYQGKLILPRPYCSTVPNCCVICLEEYKPGSSVVWSTNADCEHAFHRDCIVKYFDKIQRKVAETPCPCCRAKYTDMSVEIRAKRGRRRRIRTTTGVSIPWFR
mmetsp:Transcript_2791/g.5041  ORF Transcript_2791/g.5041 Transcript_2791/m.5041 type:complete len:211 (-) Transcript_2791:309-941(-)